jgi:hypothetical protein
MSDSATSFATVSLDELLAAIVRRGALTEPHRLIAIEAFG